MASSPWWSILTDLLWSLPSFTVSIIAMAVALNRWKRHPTVSALVLISVGMLIVVGLVHRIGARLIVDQANAGGWGSESIDVYLGVLSIGALPIRISAWAMLLVALFGWRERPADQPRTPAFQFSIRSVMIVTVVIALLCALGRGLVWLFGEQAGVLLSSLNEVPIIVCQLVGIWLAIARWSWHPRESQLALLGFGCMLAALVIMWIGVWFVMTMSYDEAVRAELFLGPVGTALATLGWVLIIVAIFSRGEFGPTKPAAAMPNA
jgi:hypothetical protein